MPKVPFLGFLSYDPRIVEADLAGKAPFEDNADFQRSMKEILNRLQALKATAGS
jgi:CO dehydrogenase nickel-insertion accessory protein CooC1